MSEVKAPPKLTHKEMVEMFHVVDDGAVGRRVPPPQKGEPLFIVRIHENFKDGNVGGQNVWVYQGDTFVMGQGLLQACIRSGMEVENCWTEHGIPYPWESLRPA